MSAQKGDFISFSFNGVHSSKLGIIRTSDGSRFNENLLPTIQDKTVQVPGGDGTYFFGSYYTQRQFNVPIAFDSLTEKQVRGLYSHFGDKQIHELIFDERPYKVYMAKINGTPQIKTICFDGPEGRIYKGEGTLNFICYYPFAKSRFKYLDEYTLESIPEWVDWPGTTIENDLYNPGVIDEAARGNLDEWAAASGMKDSKGTIYDIYNPETGEIKVFNAGDIDADFIILLPSINMEGSIVIDGKNSLDFLNLKPDEGSQDNLFCFNSKNNLIEGCIRLDSKDELIKYKLTGSLYNKKIIGGDFFKIPPGEHTIGLPTGCPSDSVAIFYNHLYY